MKFYMKGMTRNAQHYVEHLKEQINLFSSNGVGGFNVKIYLDCEGWSGDVMAFYVSSQEKDKLISTVEGLPMRLQRIQREMRTLSDACGMSKSCLMTA